MSNAEIFFEKYNELLTTQNLQPRRAYWEAEQWWMEQKSFKKFKTYASFKASISRWRRRKRSRRGFGVKRGS